MISVLHLVGSPVDEFHADLSRLYARDCLAALDASHRYRHQIADLLATPSQQTASERTRGR